MAHSYDVKILGFSVLPEITGVRTAADFSALLDVMEYGDTTGLSDSDLREMCLMSLQDREPAEAAAVVLRYDLGSALRPGQIKQMSHAMTEEKIWEEYPDMALHERLFNGASLMHAAMPQAFPEPDAVRVTLEVTAGSPKLLAVLDEPAAESFVVRLVADGMPDGAILRRLFQEQLDSTAFPEASSIIWGLEREPLTETSLKLHITGSGYWLAPLQETRQYESSAYPDEPPEDAADAPRD